MNDNYNKVLNLAVKIEQEKERHNTILDELIDELLIVAHSQEQPRDGTDWTSDRFANDILTEYYRAVYQKHHGRYVEDVYNMGANIMNITQHWNLTCIPTVKHIFWAFESTRLFGINLFSTRPRFAIFYVSEDGNITEDEVVNFVPDNDLHPYPQYKQLIFQLGTTITELHALFEEICSRRVGENNNNTP